MAILEDSHQNFTLFSPLLRGYFDCCQEDESSWAVKVNRLPLLHRPDCVIIGNVKYAFLCLDFPGVAWLVCVSSKPQKRPIPGLSKCSRLVGEKEPRPLPAPEPTPSLHVLCSTKTSIAQALLSVSLALPFLMKNKRRGVREKIRKLGLQEVNGVMLHHKAKFKKKKKSKLKLELTFTKEVLLQPSLNDKEFTSTQERKNILEKDNSMSKGRRRWKHSIFEKWNKFS
ncbi:uncharacterized protein LOC122235760 [Panthera tigris]|uniref:uncharacterized protein LOC122235760 n=1 Tax=Panthera tigris TaxID=9694 RepID=UPI001C6F8238|nr:uncharacterized protein LOC122235760 [Panthera tigris]